MRYAIAGITLVVLLGLAGRAYLGPPAFVSARAAAGETLQVERDGRRVVYHARGNGPRILLHASAGREASDFNELTTELVAAGYRTLAVEAPGIGGSTLPEAALDLYMLAGDLNAVLAADVAALGGPAMRSAAIGHAFGNRVVRAAATRYPEAFGPIVLLAAGGARPVPAVADAALKGSFDPLSSRWARAADVRTAFFAAASPIPDHWLRGWHIRTALQQGRASGLSPDDAWLAAGSARMLVVQAAEDRVAPRADSGDRLAADHPDRVELVVLPETGHALLPEAPERIAQLVLEFLQREYPISAEG